MPADVLTRLLRGEHPDVEERHTLKLWPPETLRYSEVRHHLCKLLQNQEWFPSSPVASEAIYIERRGTDDYRCVVWPGQGARSAEHSFSTSQDAADFYLKWELHLPGSLDSWPVVDDR